MKIKNFLKIGNWKLKIGFLGLALLAIGFFYFTQKASAAWWDDTWGYRQKVEIANTGSAQTDFQTMITLDTQTLATAGKIQTDCDDLRVTDNLGNLLNFWIEPTTCNTTTTKIWLKLSSIPASGSTLYLYYGNPSATAANQVSPSNIFIREISNVQGAWTLDETSSPAADSSGNGNNGTWNGNTYTTGKFSNAGSFDGAARPNADFVQMGNMDDVFTGSNPRTFSAWIKSDLTQDGAFLAKADNQGAGTSWMFRSYSTGAIEFRILGNSGTNGWHHVTGAGAISANAWHQVTATVTSFSPANIDIYVDGTEVASTYGTVGTPPTSWPTANTPVWIGKEEWAGSTYAFKGQVDDVRIYSAALSVSEISDLYGTGGDRQGYTTSNYANKELVRKYSSSVTIGSPASEEKSQGPVAYWSFDDGQGTVAQDATQNNNDGTITGAAWTQEDQCISGKCLKFDGTDDYVGIGTTANAVQTVSFWVKPSSNTASLIDLDGGTHYISASSGTISATGFSSPTIYVNGKSSTTLSANTWQYITVTTSTSFNSTNITIGKQSSNYVQGFIDEVKIYNYARTAAQIKADYAARGTSKGTSAQIGGPSAGSGRLADGLIGYWKMDESSGNLTDSSGNGTTLTNTGTATFTGGKYGNGATLNGSSQYFSAADNTALSVTGDLTLTSWIKPSAVTAATQFDILGKWDGSNTSYLLAQYGTEIRLYLNSASNYVTTTNASLSTGTWYHILATYTASTQTVKIFVNGVEKSTTTTGTIPSSITDNASAFYVGVDNSVSQTLTLQPDGTAGLDTSIESSSGVWNTTNYGTAIYTWIGDSGGLNRMLIKFDLTDLPDTATISSATLSLYALIDGSDNARTFRVYRQKRAWVESQATGVIYSTGNNWAIAGGFGSDDSEQTEIGSRAFSASETMNQFKDFPLTPTTKANLDLGNGWLIKADTEVANDQYVFASSENTNSAQRPKLVINYLGLGNYFNGSIDEARVYNRALTAKEATDLYEFAPGPVLHLKMDEKVSGDAKTLNDSSGYGNNGTTVDGANNTGMNCNKPGKYGSACSFDGTDDYVSVSDSNTLDPTQISVSFWINPTSFSGSPIIISHGDNNAGWYVELSTNGKLIFSSVANYKTSVTGTLSTGSWQHVEITHDGSNDKFYVNGILTDTIAQTTAITNYAGEFRIAQYGGNGYFYNGYLDDVKIYNYARTQKQIIQDMEGGSVIASGARQSAIAYWKFDEGYGQTANNSGNGGSTLNGTISNGTWSMNGKFGKALTFASNTSVTATITDPGYSNTISLWINPTTSVASKTLVTATKLITDSSSRPTFGNCTGTALGLNSWTHIVAVSDGSGSCKIYQNGVQTASGTTGVTFGTSINVGASSYTGQIDEVKIYNYALTADEVKADYNQGQSMVLGAAGTNSSYAQGAANQEYCIPGDSTSCAAPVARWDFEEGSGTVKDTSGNNNTGTWSGTGAKHWDVGKIGKAGKFNGSDDYVNIGDSDILDIGTSDFTISAWFKLTDNTQLNSVIVEKRAVGSPYTGYVLYFQDDAVGGCSANSFRGQVNTGALTDRCVAAGYDVRDGKWHHIEWTVDRDSATGGKFYLDGAQIGTGQDFSSQTATIANTVNFSIGKSLQFDNDLSKGLIDQVRIYNYARSAAQVAWDYNRGAPVGHWKFDECQGSVAHDSADLAAGGSGNNGTITIGPSGSQTSQGTCTSSGAWYNGVTGKFNSSLKLDGSDDKVAIPNAITGVQSVSFWVNPAVTTDSFMDLDGGTHYITASTGTVSATGFSSPTIYVNGVSGGTITGGAWNHVVVTTATSFNSTSSFTLGYKSAATADYLNGQMDDVQVYNYALTPVQVKTVYNNGAVYFGPSSGTP